MSETAITIRKTGLIRLDQATKALAEASTLSEIKGIRDKAEVIRKYAATSGAGLDIQNAGAELKLRAERKAGPLIPPQFPQGRPKKTLDEQTFLEDMGITRFQSHCWQREAKIPEKEFEEYIEKIKAERKELTSAGVLRLARVYQPKPETKPLPDNKYKVVYADPPWKYSDKLVEGYGAAEHHYPTMSIEELCGMKVKDIILPNAVLFVWVTSPMLAECWPVIEAWGFEYKTSFVWDKIKHNMGHYNSVRHELLLVCTKGSCLPEDKKLEDSVVSIERKEHSEKPEYFRKLIDKMYPTGKRIELFAREKTDGWESYGNEAEQLCRIQK